MLTMPGRRAVWVVSMLGGLLAVAGVLLRRLATDGVWGGWRGGLGRAECASGRPGQQPCRHGLCRVHEVWGRRGGDLRVSVLSVARLAGITRQAVHVVHPVQRGRAVLHLQLLGLGGRCLRTVLDVRVGPACGGQLHPLQGHGVCYVQHLHRRAELRDGAVHRAAEPGGHRVCLVQHVWGGAV